MVKKILPRVLFTKNKDSHVIFEDPVTKKKWPSLKLNYYLKKGRDQEKNETLPIGVQGMNAKGFKVEVRLKRCKDLKEKFWPDAR